MDSKTKEQIEFLMDMGKKYKLSELTYDGLSIKFMPEYPSYVPEESIENPDNDQEMTRDYLLEQAPKNLF